MEELLKFQFLHNRVERWALAAAAFVLIYVSLKVIRKTLVKRLHPEHLAWPLRGIGEVLKATRHWFFFVVAAAAAVQFLSFPDHVDKWVNRVISFAFILQVLFWGMGVIRFGVGHYTKSSFDNGDSSRATSLKALGVFFQFLFACFILLWGLDNLGIKVTSVIAGLGIGGIAVAFALQNILGNLFSSLTILFDKPFVIGDTITFNGMTGTVEKIGFNTTRLRSVDGEEIVWANSELLKTRIQNNRSLSKRRVLTVITVAPRTSPDQLAAIPGILKANIEKTANTRFDRAHFRAVTLKGFEVEVCYFITSGDYPTFMDAQQAVLLGTLKDLRSQNIETTWDLAITDQIAVFNNKTL